MRFMMLVKSAENQGRPPKELMDAMERISEEAAKANTMVDSGGLAPTAMSQRVRLSRGNLSSTQKKRPPRRRCGSWNSTRDTGPAGRARPRSARCSNRARDRLADHRCKGLLQPGVKAGAIVAWLKRDFGLGPGHAMAIYATFKGRTK